MKVYVLFRETSDQYGTEEIDSIYVSKELCNKKEIEIAHYRIRVQEYEVIGSII